MNPMTSASPARLAPEDADLLNAIESAVQARLDHADRSRYEALTPGQRQVADRVLRVAAGNSFAQNHLPDLVREHADAVQRELSIPRGNAEMFAATAHARDASVDEMMAEFDAEQQLADDAQTDALRRRLGLTG
ncbi:hypothetical protein [Parahaliea mediterranea]|uniref:hypothetical protein n=1 Tax=Parahaliea mediterranea TaxID=651086 RepID=UPI000E2FA184|nr:hypothetical protein [Parahaliea mediterranea]